MKSAASVTEWVSSVVAVLWPSGGKHELSVTVTWQVELSISRMQSPRWSAVDHSNDTG